MYIVGVDEKPVIHLFPQPLAGLKERIGDVAKDAVRPALRIDARDPLAVVERLMGPSFYLLTLGRFSLRH